MTKPQRLIPLRDHSTSPMPWIKSSIDHASAWVPPAFNKDAIRLDLNENQFVDPHEIEKLSAGISNSNLYKYPDYSSLTNTISSTYGIVVDQLLITNGADQAIEIVIRSLNPMGRVTIVVPTFSYYSRNHKLTRFGCSLRWN